MKVLPVEPSSLQSSIFKKEKKKKKLACFTNCDEIRSTERKT